MKKISLIFCILLFCLSLAAQTDSLSNKLVDSTLTAKIDTTELAQPKSKPEGKKTKLNKIRINQFLESRADTLTDEFLDTLVVKKNLVVNNYSLIGVQYGAGLSRMSFNPRQKQSWLFVPVNFGVTYTKYGQMFAMPFFAFKAGLFYAREGYQFEYNEEHNWTYKIEGAEKAIYEVVEVPLLFQFHYDAWNFKIMAEVGCFGGYRIGIERFPGETGSVSEELQYSFKDTDIRMDFGIKGGVGLGLVFDPLEFHISLSYKHSLSSIYAPNYYSEYFYRYAYPTNFILSFGVNYQLSKRTGKTRAELKQEARDIVYGTNENL